MACAMPWTPVWPARAHKKSVMLKRLLSSSRFLMLVAVLGAFLAFAALLLYGGAQTLALLATIFNGGLDDDPKQAILAAIQITDLFLLAALLYIIALGLYELFIDDTLDLPAWLLIHNLDDLKEKLLGVVVVVMAVFFLGKLLGWDGSVDLLSLGFAASTGIAALTYFLKK